MNSRPLDPVVGLKRTMKLYARLQGDLDRLLIDADFTATERRILLELMEHPRSTDAEVAAEVGLERSQLSRTVANLLSRGLICHEPSSKHRSQRLLFLSEKGAEAAHALDAELEKAIARQFETLSGKDQKIILRAVGGGAGEPYDVDGGYPVKLRPPRLNDFSWVFERMTADGFEYGWSDAFVANAANRISDFLGQPYEYGQVGWIADRFGTRVGACLMTLEDDLQDAQIATLFVDPRAQRLGIGSRLLEACLDKARDLTLLSVSAEASERQAGLDRFYRTHGLQREKEKAQDHRFGPLEIWRTYRIKLPLARPAPEDADRMPDQAI